MGAVQHLISEKDELLEIVKSMKKEITSLKGEITFTKSKERFIRKIEQEENKVEALKKKEKCPCFKFTDLHCCSCSFSFLTSFIFFSLKMN